MIDGYCPKCHEKETVSQEQPAASAVRYCGDTTPL